MVGGIASWIFCTRVFCMVCGRIVDWVVDIEILDCRDLLFCGRVWRLVRPLVIYAFTIVSQLLDAFR